MTYKIYPDEKSLAEVLAKLLQNGAVYTEVQSALLQAKEYDIEKVREHLGNMTSKELLVQHDLEIELERFSNRNHRPKADASFHKMIKNIHSDLEKEGLLAEAVPQPKSKIVAFFPKYKWAIAAVFLALVGLISLWQLQLGTSTETLFASYFEPLPDEYTAVIEKQLAGLGAALNLEKLMAQKTILAAYSEGDYAKTILLTKAYFEKYPPAGLAGEGAIKLYAGISYLEQNQLAEAIELLKPLSEDIRFSKQTAAQWYLTLAWIRQNDFEKANTLLHIISEDDSSKWQASARALLKELG